MYNIIRMWGINALTYLHTTIPLIQKHDPSYNYLITRLATQLKCPTHHPQTAIPSLQRQSKRMHGSLEHMKGMIGHKAYNDGLKV